MKKDWRMRRASHYRLRDQNPMIRYSSPAMEETPTPQIDLDFSLPIVSKAADAKNKKKKKRKAKRDAHDHSQISKDEH